MDIQLLSDLHLESPKGYDLFEITPTASYLALLGDIGNLVAHKDEVLAFLSTQLRQFKAVLFVPGNHEAYHSDWEQTIRLLRVYEEDVRRDASLGEFVVLDREAFQPPGTDIVILGCSLFSHVPKESEMAVEMGFNDFYRIEDWSVAAHNSAHRRDLDWLNDQVTELESRKDVGRIAIFTHWNPSRDPRTGDPRHAGSAITPGFSTDLARETCFTSEKVKVWAYGHTHYNCDVMVKRDGGADELRLMTNQRGYYFAQAEGFNVEKTIHL